MGASGGGRSPPGKTTQGPFFLQTPVVVAALWMIVYLLLMIAVQSMEQLAKIDGLTPMRRLPYSVPLKGLYKGPVEPFF